MKCYEDQFIVQENAEKYKKQNTKKYGLTLNVSTSNIFGIAVRL